MIRRSTGIGTLETALALMVLLPVLLGGFAVVEYVQSVMYLNDVLDKYLYNDSVKPFTVRNDAAGNFSLQLNRNDLQSYVDKMLDRTKDDLAKRLAARGSGVSQSTSQKFFIEASVVELPIDPSSGTPGRFQERIRTTRGGLQIPESAKNKADLYKEFEILSSRTVTGTSDGPSIYAVPAVMYNSSKPKYLDGSVLVGLRIFLSLDQSFSGYIFNTLGFGESPIVSAHKAFNLRGDLEF